MLGVDHYGGDIDAMPTNTYQECRQKCNENPQCKAAVFLIL